ncbi:MAG TPA: hypothetical protein ENJ18_00390 [Nannocystis exedens]|nr:hypothetical protein [Nannocystis exedens]
MMDPRLEHKHGQKRSRPFLKRRQFLELHEQAWFPKIWRHLFRAGLGKAFVIFGFPAEISRVLSLFLDEQQPPCLLDLCSGSGELSAHAWRQACSTGGNTAKCRLLLSDLYPEIELWSDLNPNIHFVPDSVDITNIETTNLDEDCTHTRMTLNSLHHFPPAELRSLLDTTANSCRGFIAIDRDARNLREMLITIFIVPLAAAWITAFMLRPFRLQNVLWSLIIPVIPLVALFDGIVSNLRSYTTTELHELCQENCPPSFEWRVGTTPGGHGAPPLVYIIGSRESPQSAPCNP